MATTRRGTNYGGKVAPFLREIREEVLVDWTALAPNTVIAVICKLYPILASNYITI